MTEIKRLKLALLVLHAVGTVFAIVVFAITAASIAEANRAAAAVNSNVAQATGALSSLQNSFNFNNFNRHRKLLANAYNSFMVVGFTSFLNFTMFVSISGMLLSGFLALCYFKTSIYDKTLGALANKSPAWAKWPFYELVIAIIWSIFWLAAAGAASDSPFVRIAGYCTGVSACDQINAVVALSWLSWLLWLAVVVLLAVEYGMAARKGRKLVAPVAPAAATPAPAKAADVEALKSQPVVASEAPAAAETAPATVVVPGTVPVAEEEKPQEGKAEVELASHP